MGSKSDQPRFERLLREHGRIVFKVAGMYAGRGDDRRDLEQEICTQAWRSFPHYDERRAKFSTWLYRVALNAAISQVRRRHSAAAAPHEPLDEHHLDTIAAEPENEGDERIAQMRVFIDQLDPLNRALILLYLEDRGYAEIADILGISETNVATKLGRIKQKLRFQMTANEPIATRA